MVAFARVLGEGEEDADAEIDVGGRPVDLAVRQGDRGGTGVFEVEIGVVRTATERGGEPPPGAVTD